MEYGIIDEKLTFCFNFTIMKKKGTYPSVVNFLFFGAFPNICKFLKKCIGNVCIEIQFFVSHFVSQNEAKDWYYNLNLILEISILELGSTI